MGFKVTHTRLKTALFTFVFFVNQERVPLSESLEVHQMLSACLEETIIRNINFIAGDKEFQDRNRYPTVSI